MEERSFSRVIKDAARDGSRYACPCCGHRALQQRGKGEVCRGCYWQDDGQDDPFADEVWGGGNGKLSLAEARQNFRQCGAYDPRIGNEPSRPAPKIEEAPAAAKPEIVRKPPPWWTQLGTTQRRILWVEAVLLCLAALCAYVVWSGRVTGEMLKDRGYYLWARGKGRYNPEYVQAFARDRKHQERFFGKPVDTLHPFFPNLLGGGYFERRTQERLNPGHNFPSTDGQRVQTYWLDSHLGGRVYCVLVLEGEIRDFFFSER